MDTKSTNAQNIKHQIKSILTYIGEDVTREGLIDTPIRMIKSFNQLFEGYNKNAHDILNSTFTDKCDEMIILKNIDFYSTCEHHFLPFFGKVHIGYLPNKKIVGISKLARLVEMYSRRLQIQERLTLQIAEDIYNILDSKGCIVIIKAQHFCITSRGVQKQNAEMITSSIKGVFEKNEPRTEFLKLIDL